MTETEALLAETGRTRLLVLDSGVGGLAYIRRLLRIRDAYTICYLADTAGFPYGEKDPEWLRGHIVHLVGRALLQFPVDMVLIACNTASVSALAALRATYDIPFVGTVPAVKPAANLTRSGVIGLLATSATVGDDYTDRLVAEFAAHFTVIRSGAPELVRKIEGGFPHLSETAEVEKLLQRELFDFAEARADVVVLGCTHFLHITPLLERVAKRLGNKLQLVDSLDGVARRVVELTHRDQRATVTGFGRALVKPGRSGGARRTGLTEPAKGLLLTTRYDSRGAVADHRRYVGIGESYGLRYVGELSL
ncbi:MAG: glutamate racemase [Spirochaetaceae bacterium]